MRKVNSKIEDIISQIQALKGQSVSLEISRGRQKTIKYSGVIESVYPSIFTVRSPTNKNSLSYSYADVMCGEVKFKTHKNQEVLDKLQQEN